MLNQTMLMATNDFKNKPDLQTSKYMPVKCLQHWLLVEKWKFLCSKTFEKLPTLAQLSTGRAAPEVVFVVDPVDSFDTFLQLLFSEYASETLGSNLKPAIEQKRTQTFINLRLGFKSKSSSEISSITSKTNMMFSIKLSLQLKT